MVRLGLVVSTYHRPITEAMESDAIDAADTRDATVAAVVHVPGTYDTVLPADRLARRDDIDAVAVIGAIVEGETDHDQVIGHTVATQLQEIARARDTPVTLGVSGPGIDAETARNRIEYGPGAVDAAIDLVEALEPYAPG